MSSQLIVRLSQERDKYSALAYNLSKALKNILNLDYPIYDESWSKEENITKYVEEVLKQNNLLYK
jgi:hypothetical protein